MAVLMWFSCLRGVAAGGCEAAQGGGGGAGGFGYSSAAAGRSTPLVR